MSYCNSHLMQLNFPSWPNVNGARQYRQGKIKCALVPFLEHDTLITRYLRVICTVRCQLEDLQRISGMNGHGYALLCDT
jgi:hypothetical protein